MRPTVNEQLDQATRLLETIVLPNLDEGRPREILLGVVGNLKMLVNALVDLPGFLAWDNAATRSLLETLGVQISAAEGAQPSEVWLDEAELLNENLRRALTDVILGLPADDAKLIPVRAHLADRASRFPMRPILPTPQASKARSAT